MFTSTKWIFTKKKHGFSRNKLFIIKTIDSNNLPAYFATKKLKATIKYRVLEVWKDSCKDSIIHINQDFI
jgi:hypothetical protein|tara:strand:- start:23 stop:232 length:210 start_codon:yes stop_codon:yes gene_type:complete